MKKQLNQYINNELLILKTVNGSISTSVGTVVRLRKNAMQIKYYSRVGEITDNIFQPIHEFIPYNSILKVSTGQKVLSR